MEHITKIYDEFVENNWMGKDSKLHLAIATLGLNGEAGEVAEKIKKHLRGDEAHNPRERTDILLRNHEIVKELGDVLFYLTWLAQYHGASLGDVIVANMEKLRKRVDDTGTLRGDGDNR